MNFALFNFRPAGKIFRTPLKAALAASSSFTAQSAVLSTQEEAINFYFVFSELAAIAEIKDEDRLPLTLVQIDLIDLTNSLLSETLLGQQSKPLDRLARTRIRRSSFATT
ncbi:hypothetical protein MBM_06365 [Drepanopeziza brunnea f. sp. 'multigermtubi' MB_m1]|uniref:Uncharacterized protein n=1 Tax=Marssonina brunnea f. sp. multigermtubi (strain MB_m1) TaxID=1072389 RepID=K1XRF0_MARBU|nr:uncharacterized protein MBM_06365 [Drepanopeziza brunnea f. sp. 'multigermtubi' MB_m1]EKD15149.1 hypothetical protein MBM_06365 [Drepanopeziza brunnea f. sp. 'multigermtubi' MB_m1]